MRSTTRFRGRYAGGVPDPLPESLYGGSAALATDPVVQAAPTVTEMIARSRVPRELWYAPPPVVRVVPQVDPVDAAEIAEAVQELRRRFGRPRLASRLGTTQSAVWRAENSRLRHAEVATWRAWLAELNEPHDRGREER